MNTSNQIELFLGAAVEVVDDARRRILTMTESGFAHRHKADRSFVTEVDLAVETAMRDALLARFPTHDVLGEEYGARGADSRYRWVIDPIDGTMSLRHGIPLFGTLLALLDGGEPIVAVLDLPMLGRRFHAGRGLGAFRNDEPWRLEDDGTPIDDQVIAVGDRKQFVAAGMLDAFDRLMAEHPTVRTYTDCFGHALALDGAVGAMVDVDLRLWDLVATRLLIQEAGGVIHAKETRTDRGEPRYHALFGRPRTVAWILEAVPDLAF